MLTVHHSTVYRYRQPVSLGPHRLMLRPRDSHDLRIVETGLHITPAATLKWFHDVFGNSVAVATFVETADTLRIDSILRLQQFADRLPDAQIEGTAASYPFLYTQTDKIDLGAMLIPHYADPDGQLAAWARAFVMGDRTATLSLLSELNTTIRNRFGYQARDTEGTQTPLQTLDRGWGTCRDFAVLLVDAARHLGFGARIVTGYLEISADAPSAAHVSASPDNGATHAWADIYLPGVGWLAFDPTNGSVGEHGLIPVAVAREIGQAIAIAGSFTGLPDDYLDMTVTVAVTRDHG